MEVSVKVDMSKLTSNISRTVEAMRAPALWAAIGMALKAETLRCFEREQAPDGTPWAPLSPVTIARRRGGRKGKATSGNVKILQDTGLLRGSIDTRWGKGWCSVGTPVKYGRKHQFGQFVPRRPFLGVSRNFMLRMTVLMRMSVRGLL